MHALHGFFCVGHTTDLRFMNTLTQSETFFFISSIGSITLWVLIAVFLLYLIRSMHTFSRIMKMVEKDVEKIGDTTKEMVEGVQDSLGDYLPSVSATFWLSWLA
jgi:hypothetical protein